MKQISTALSFLVVTFFTGMISAQETKPEVNPKSLMVIEGEEDVKKVKTKESEVSLVDVGGKKCLKVDFQASPKYPDIALESATGSWDLSAFGGVRAEITNTGSTAVKVAVRVDNPGTPTEKKWITGSGDIEPGATQVIEVDFVNPGKAKEGKAKASHVLNPAEVKAVHVFLNQPKSPVSLVVKSLQAFGAPKVAVAGSAVSQAAVEQTERPPAVKRDPWTKPLLLDFADADVKSLITTNDSTFEIIDVNGTKVARVKTGCKNPYPNITFKAPTEAWNLAAYTNVEFDLTNNTDESISLAARVDNPNATGRSNSNGAKIALDPGERGGISVEIDRYFAEKLRESLKGMHHTPWGGRGTHGAMIDPGNIVQVSIFLSNPARSYDVTIHSIKATGVFDPKSEVIPDPFFPFVDRYGQYMHQDWPGKVKAESDFAREKAAELKYIDTNPRPSSWNRFGGWVDGPQLPATGSFYTAKHEGKWHLVDPEGRLFFSLGMDVVVTKNATPIEQREGWFADEPWKNSKEFGAFLDEGKESRHGDYKGMKLKTFNFYEANLLRKYGPDWESTWEGLMPKRLMNWGFNTIGNWSEPKVLAKGGIPYTGWVFLQVKNLPWQANTRNPIPDPFNPEFDEEVKKATVRFTRDTLNDPMCIGYFVDNELSWRDDTFQAKAALAGTKANFSKVELVKHLEENYGTIEKLNAAWGVKLSKWEEMHGYKEIPKTEAGIKDLRAFNAKIAHRYFQGVSKAIKEVAPKKLYLGCRFADHNAQVVKIAAEYCDVVSFNIYRDTIAAWKPVVEINKPVMIGEFHFGATDRGVFGPGLCKAKSAEDRAVKFSRYVMGAASNPSIVGVHWFCLKDESMTGRPSDGENHGVGFLSVTDTPYLEMIEASRKVAHEIYPIRSKK